MNMNTLFDSWFDGGACNMSGYLPQGIQGQGLEGSFNQGGPILKQADNIYDITNTFPGYINPKYSALIAEWNIVKRNFYSLIRKTDFGVLGDAFKAWSDDPANIEDVVKGVDESDPIFDTNDRMPIEEVKGSPASGIRMKLYQAHWTEGLLHQIKQAGFQNAPQITNNVLRAKYTTLWMRELNKAMLVDAGTSYSKPKQPISFDALISGKSEADLRGYSSGEIDLWNIDRTSAESKADSILDVADTPRAFDLDVFDDKLAELSDYSPGEPFAIMTPLVLNRVERSIKAKQQFIGKNKVVIQRNGVHTRAGETAGFQIATYAGGGIQEFPLFSDPFVDKPNGSKGNLMVIDNDDAEFRIARPESYVDTGKNHALIGDGRYITRYLLDIVGESIVSHPNKHLKYSTLE